MNSIDDIGNIGNAVTNESPEAKARREQPVSILRRYDLATRNLGATQQSCQAGDCGGLEVRSAGRTGKHCSPLGKR